MKQLLTSDHEAYCCLRGASPENRLHRPKKLGGAEIESRDYTVSNNPLSALSSLLQSYRRRSGQRGKSDTHHVRHLVQDHGSFSELSCVCIVSVTSMVNEVLKELYCRYGDVSIFGYLCLASLADSQISQQIAVCVEKRGVNSYEEQFLRSSIRKHRTCTG